VLAITGLILYPLPGWRIVLIAFGIAWVGGMGVTVCYHRAIAHGSLRLNPIVRHVMIFVAMFNGSGAPPSWTANHRQHHSRVETSEDISSPWIGGFWWAHLRWLWQTGQVPLDRWCPDLDKPEYRFWTRVQIPVVVLSVFFGLAFSPAGLLLVRPHSPSVRVARAVLHQQRRAHARGAQGRRGFVREPHLARRDAVLPG